MSERARSVRFQEMGGWKQRPKTNGSSKAWRLSWLRQIQLVGSLDLLTTRPSSGLAGYHELTLSKPHRVVMALSRGGPFRRRGRIAHGGIRFNTGCWRGSLHPPATFGGRTGYTGRSAANS